MLSRWLLITLSWLGAARLQYISTGDSIAEISEDPLVTAHKFPIPYNPYYTRGTDPTRNGYQALDDNFPKSTDNTVQAIQRNANDDTVHFRNEEKDSPILVELSGVSDDKPNDLFKDIEKKYFSPWGGKRDQSSIEHAWTWKRGSGDKEPKMPKRVQFSPWGGKRSGQIILKLGQRKTAKKVHSTIVPALTRIVSSYIPLLALNYSGYQFIHTLDRRHPIQILSLGSTMNEKLTGPMPYNSLLEYAPKLFKPGHPYADVNLKKDGKRKIKFSAWGGKRSPPIIGPIWTPVPNNMKDSTLNTMILIRDDQEKANVNKV